MNSHLIAHARALLESDPDMIADARAGARVGNTIIGGVMSLTTGSPRWATENAVAEALASLDTEDGAR